MTSWCTRAGRPRTGVADEVASHPHAVDAPSALVDVERHDDLRGTRVSERAGEGPRPNPEPPRGVGRTGYCTVDTSGGRGQSPSAVARPATCEQCCKCGQHGGSPHALEGERPCLSAATASADVRRPTVPRGGRAPAPA